MIVVALVLSFIIKRDSEVIDYEDAFGKMKTVDTEDYMTADEIAAAKHKAEMDDKMKAMIREIIFYALLLFFLFTVINGQQDTDSFRQNSSIISLFNKNLIMDVSNYCAL